MFRSLVTRTVLPLLLAAGVVAYFGLPYIDRLLTEWFRSDVELRARLVMSSIEESLPTLIGKATISGPAQIHRQDHRRSARARDPDLPCRTAALCSRPSACPGGELR